MRRLLVIGLIAMTIISSCQKQVDSPANVISEFPNEVGNHWRYLYTRAVNQQDTIDVDIVGTHVLPNGQAAKVWAYKFQFSNYPITRDTSYVVADSQVVKIYLYAYGSYYETMRYQLPLSVGEMWTIPQNFKDSTWVLGNYPVTVPGGTFRNTFELKKERDYVLNSWTNNKIWFSPQVGLIKFDQSEFSLGPVTGNGLWELLEYSLQ